MAGPTLHLMCATDGTTAKCMQFEDQCMGEPKYGPGLLSRSRLLSPDPALGQSGVDYY